MNHRYNALRLTAGIGAVAAGSLLFAGVATAAPADTVINTPCSFSQVVAATYAISEDEGAALAASPLSSSFAAFLAAPTWQRQMFLNSQPAIIDRVNAFFGGPGSGFARTVFATCSDF
nr:hemophore-related protein [Rhodococcus sp. (in: high G+C Gram-positive bacteria)]